jgi:hypothetical protein
MLVRLIAQARMDFRAARLDSSAARAMLVLVHPATLALAPAHRMMGRVFDLVRLRDMPAHVARSEN